MIRIHYKYDHTLFNHLQSMANNGVLPKHLVHFTIPICAAFLYGKATKLPFNTKTTQFSNYSKPVTSVGDCVYVKIFLSSTPVLIALMSIFLVHRRYQYARVFVDHRYNMTYIHLIKTQTVYEVVEDKKYFEAYAESHGVDINHYHSNNE